MILKKIHASMKGSPITIIATSSIVIQLFFTLFLVLKWIALVTAATTIDSMLPTLH